MTEYVVGLAFSSIRSSVVLINKRRPAWQAGLLNGPGGHIEPGETPSAAMSREFYEETGVATHQEDWQAVAVLNFPAGRVHFFRMFSSDAIAQAFSRTDEQIEKHLIDRLPQNLVPNLRYLIPLCLFADVDASSTNLRLPVQFVEYERLAA